MFKQYPLAIPVYYKQRHLISTDSRNWRWREIQPMLNTICLTYFSPYHIAVFIFNLNFYFVKTADIPVYNILYTKMLRMHLFSIFNIKTPRTLAALAPLGL